MNNFSPIYSIQGYLVPTIPGIYPVLDKLGNPLKVSNQTNLLLSGMSAIEELVGGTDITLSTSLTNGGVPVDTFVISPATTLQINTDPGVTLLSPGIIASNNANFIVATTTGTFSSGKVLITILCLNPLNFSIN